MVDLEQVLTPRERQGLLLSVGTHRAKRPLSPVEVAAIYEKVLAAGGTMADCARASRFEGTTMVSRFLRLLKLPESVRHIVDWGSSPGTIGPSAGAELARLENASDEEEVVRGVLTYRLSGSEVRQIVQLNKRSKRPLKECLDEVVGMRPRIEKRFVYVGAITDVSLKQSLEQMTQQERDELLRPAMKEVLPAVRLAVTRLAPGRFTLVGGADFGEAINLKKNSLEQEINDALAPGEALMCHVDVTSSGAVLLGDHVVCDGFQRDRAVRVQTHVHDDHMHDFERSKGLQNLYMSNATRSLLIAEFNADLEYRENIIAIPHGYSYDCDGTGRLTLLSSGHMLGAVQVALETPDGRRLGYSGDFHWPIDDVIQVDELVIDSTYGNEGSIREYTQGEAEARFLQLVYDKLGHGSVHVKAHRGTVQRALQILHGNIGVPILASARLCKEVAVYQQFGCAIGNLMLATSPEGRAVIKTRKYVRLYSKGDGDTVDLPEGASIRLSAYMSKTNDPVIEFSERGYSVALSNHADFNGTLEYVLATGAKRVVTDNTRGHGIDLALAIQQRLGIDARPSTNLESNEWGVG